MNKKTTFALLLGVIFTSIISCNTPSTTATEGSTPATKIENTAKSISDSKIVYINNDSLISGYKYYKELEAEYKAKADKAQAELQSKSRSFERKVTEAQEKIQKGLVTRQQAAELEQSIQMEQQSLIEYRDKIMAELGEEERVMFNKIWNNVSEFLKKFNEEKKYDLILNQNSATNSILIGSPDLDITTIVLEGLNNEHAATAKK